MYCLLLYNVNHWNHVLIAETLQRDIESEKSSGEFVALPPHFLEVASILFDW